jgi:hypothetical protein
MAADKVLLARGAAAKHFTTTYANAILGSVQLKSLLSSVVLTVMTSGANT